MPLLARIRYWAWEVRNPDKPWLCPATVQFCDQNLDRSMIGLKFGSGRSTAWFARKLGRLVSIEHQPAWYERIRSPLARDGLVNVDYRFIPLDPESPDEEALPESICHKYAAVADEYLDESLDLIVVDGPYRIDCIRRCLN